jgi:predicted nuclease of predicted toxin-antitoxin system
MKLLFDQNLSFKLCRLLGDIFPDSQQVRLAGLESADDSEIWNYAAINGFTIVTLDADFSEMAALIGSPPKVIWLRCGNQKTATVEALLRSHLRLIRTFQDDSAACLEIY